MLAVILLCLSLCIAFIVRRHIKRRSAYKLPPSMPGELPIIGHTHTLLMEGRKDLWSLVKRMSAYAMEKGGIIYGQVLQNKYYVITDPEDAFTVANSSLVKHFIYQFGKSWIGQGLVTGSGEIYQFHRKLLNSQHATPIVHAYLKLFNDQVKKICSAMSSYDGKKHFDVSNIIKEVVLETSCLTTFGFTVKDDNLIQNYMIGVEEEMKMIMYRFTNVFLYNNIIYKLLGYQKKEDQVINKLANITNSVIQKKKEAMNNTKNDPDLVNTQDSTYKSMLDYLLELESDGLLTEDEVKEELDTNIAASFDTVAHTIFNMLLHLGTYPEVQDRMYKELMQVLGKDRDVEKQDLKKLVYIKAVIKESLRVMPTVPAIARYADKEVRLKNYIISPGSQCIILPYGINRSPAWGPDAEQFKPERWLDPASVPSNVNCFAGFSLGKRSCIGIPYAMTLLTVLLAHLVRQIKWASDITRVKSQLHMTLRPIAGHEISVKRRPG